LGFSPNESYWLLHSFGKTPNISHATTTGLESAGKKRLNPTVPDIIENLLENHWLSQVVFLRSDVFQYPFDNFLYQPIIPPIQYSNTPVNA